MLVSTCSRFHTRSVETLFFGFIYPFSSKTQNIYLKEPYCRVCVGSKSTFEEIEPIQVLLSPSVTDTSFDLFFDLFILDNFFYITQSEEETCKKF